MMMVIHLKEKSTMLAIAQATKLSIATVSRYFNSPDIVAVKSKEKIERAIDEMGYAKNAFAKVLATGRSELIGVIVPNLSYDFYGNLLEEILKVAEVYHLKCLIYNSSSDAAKEVNYIKELNSYQVNGILNLSNTLDSKILSTISPNVVGIERESNHIKGVVSDNRKGGEIQAQILHQSCCDHLVYCSSQSGSIRTARLRQEAFLQYCLSNTLQCHSFERTFTKDNAMDDVILTEFYHELKQLGSSKIGVAFTNDIHAAAFLNIFRSYRI